MQKPFTSMYNCSMVGAGANLFAVWGYVMAHTARGVVDLNPNLVAFVVGMTVPDVVAVIEELKQPDPKRYGWGIEHESGFRYRVTFHDDTATWRG
jgi:hypothetical protein